METSRVGKRGTVVVPAKLRQRFGLREGTLLIAEEQSGGILLRPAVVVPIETYSDDRKAEFLLNNAVDAEDYAETVKESASWDFRRRKSAISVPPRPVPHRRRDCRVFLDANVLFSAAYREKAGLQILWKLRGVRLVTSWYAAQEAANNLQDPDQHLRLRTLLEGVEIVAEGAEVVGAAAPGLWAEIALPDKDRPIFAAALEAESDFLLTGDVRHFGMYFDQEVRGIRILRPAEFLKWFQASER